VKVAFRQASQQGRDLLDQLDSEWFEVTLKGSCCSWDGFMQQAWGLQPIGICSFYLSKFNSLGKPSWVGVVMQEAVCEPSWELDGNVRQHP